MGRPLGRNVRRLRRCMLMRQRLPWRAHSLNNRLPQNYQLWMPQACDDAARKAAAATDDKPARSWAKHTTRRTNTSYRLTLELSGGAAVRLNDWLGICGQSATRRATRCHAIPTSHKPHALKLDGLPRTPNRRAEAKHYTTTR